MNVYFISEVMLWILLTESVVTSTGIIGCTNSLNPRILLKTILSSSKITPYQTPISDFHDPENPAKRPDCTLTSKSDNWDLFAKITPYFTPIPTPKTA